MGEFEKMNQAQVNAFVSVNTKNDKINENSQELEKKVIVSVSPDAFSVSIKLIMPKLEEDTIDENDILNALKEYGIVRGIKTSSISRLVEYRLYEKSFIVAEGAEPTQGKDAEIICHFNRDNNLVPRVLENGNVDYKNIGFANEVKEGDLLCDIIAAIEGAAGFDVLGNIKPTKTGKLLPSPNGSNTKLSEDGTQLYATCDGHVSMKDNKVCVRRVMTVDQVDKTTGNILFSGDVTVEGDVSDGFTIRVGGSITVKGVVENAVLVAGRDIVVSKGIKGKDSMISAGGTLRAGYIETAKVKVKECIYVDAVLNADVECGDKMIVVGRRGCLIGGVCHVVNELQVKEVGNEANISTEITVAAPIVISPERENLLSRIASCKENIEQFTEILRVSTQSVMPHAEKQELIAQVMANKKESEAELRALSAQLEDLDLDTEIEYSERILLHGHMYPNVSLSISGLLLKNTVMRPACTISRKKDSITFGAHK